MPPPCLVFLCRLFAPAALVPAQALPAAAPPCRLFRGRPGGNSWHGDPPGSGDDPPPWQPPAYPSLSAGYRVAFSLLGCLGLITFFLLFTVIVVAHSPLNAN